MENFDPYIRAYDVHIGVEKARSENYQKHIKLQYTVKIAIYTEFS